MPQLIIITYKNSGNLRHAAVLLYGIVLTFILSGCPVWAVDVFPRKIPDYAWLDAAKPCRYAFADRLLRQGFSIDWQLEPVCQSPDELWWVLQLRPKPRRFYHGLRSGDVGEHIIAFHFEEDIFEMASEIYKEPYKGPPKWMPAALVYWDAYIGDWRYLSRPLERQVDSKSYEPELLMLTLKFEDFDEGLSWDATFDFNRVFELLDMTHLRMDELFVELVNFFKNDE